MSFMLEQRYYWLQFRQNQSGLPIVPQSLNKLTNYVKNILNKRF